MLVNSIGHARLAKFLAEFNDDLQAGQLGLLSTLNSHASDSFAALAVLLDPASHLPDRLLSALLTLEAAASPENRDLLRQTIQRRIPCVSLNWDGPLDCALELWFLVRDELSQFLPAAPSPPPEERARGEETVSSTLNPQLSTLNSAVTQMEVEPWPEPVDASQLLDNLRQMLTRFVVLPKWVPETVALWNLHT